VGICSCKKSSTDAAVFGMLQLAADIYGTIVYEL
jgi:hypothetical protein